MNNEIKQAVLEIGQFHQQLIPAADLPLDELRTAIEKEIDVLFETHTQTAVGGALQYLRNAIAWSDRSKRDYEYNMNGLNSILKEIQSGKAFSFESDGDGRRLGWYRHTEV